MRFAHVTELHRIGELAVKLELRRHPAGQNAVSPMIDEHCTPPLANAPPFAAIRGALFRDAALRSIDFRIKRGRQHRPLPTTLCSKHCSAGFRNTEGYWRCFLSRDARR